MHKNKNPFCNLSNLLNSNLPNFEQKSKELDSYAFHSFLHNILLPDEIKAHHYYSTPIRMMLPNDENTKIYKSQPGFGPKTRHWYRFYDLCRICSIKWDFIGKVEYSQIDSEYVMEKAGYKNVLHMGFHERHTDNSKLINYFRGLPKSFVQLIFQFYEEDFDLFGYEIEEWLWENLADE